MTRTAPKTASKSPESLDVHKATVDRAQRSFVLVKVVPVRVLSENGNAITAYGLLDSAAVSSLITSDRAQKLQLEAVPEKVSINTVTHSNHACELSRVEFKIGPVDRNVPSFSVCHGLIVEDLNRSNQYCPNQIDLKECPQLKGMDLPKIDVDVSKVSVLIGQDVPQAHVVLDYCWGDNPQSQPYAMKTPFGWSVAGPTGKKEESKPIALSIFEFDFGRHFPEVVSHQQVEQFRATEKHGFVKKKESVLTVLKIDKPLKVLNARLHL